MDIARTIDLLKTQIPGQPQYDLAIDNAKETRTSTQVNKDGDIEVLTEDQQRTGEEFSTFLTLLTAQIKNQDPLAPLDSTQFVEQLATFSNLELQAKGNQSLERIAALLARQIEILTPTETPVTPSDDISTSA